MTYTIVATARVGKQVLTIQHAMPRYVFDEPHVVRTVVAAIQLVMTVTHEVSVEDIHWQCVPDGVLGDSS